MWDGRVSVVAALVVAALLGAVEGRARAEDLERARAYFRAGVEAYDQAHYQVALNEFQHAHALSHNPALYFNMAACEEHMDHFQAAALLLRQYLIENPTAEDRRNVELRIQSLESREEAVHRQEEARASPPQPSAPQPVALPPTPPERPRLKYTWALLGVTGAVGIAAIAAGAYTVAHHDSLKSGCGAMPGGCSTGDIDGLRAAAAATDALIGVTAAAAVATVVVAIIETRRHRAAHAARPASLVLAGAGVRF
jgi:hypothetical protein